LNLLLHIQSVPGYRLPHPGMGPIKSRCGIPSGPDANMCSCHHGAPRFTEAELRKAIELSYSWAETLRRLHYRSAGGNWKTLKKYAALWGIRTEHFDPHRAQAEALLEANRPKRLEEVMVENSTYARQHLKRRLFAEGIKGRR
jgi:hypothetical protein